jgi:hypothetical protein
MNFSCAFIRFSSTTGCKERIALSENSENILMVIYTISLTPNTARMLYIRHKLRANEQ